MGKNYTFAWGKVIYALIIGIVAGVSALAGVLGGGIAVFLSIKPSISKQENLPPVAVQPLELDHQNQTLIVETNIESAIIDAVDLVGPAVVTVIGKIPGQIGFFGRTPDSQVSGSGVIISEEGYLISNNHVVEGTFEVSIILADGTELPAEVVSTDPFADLAVLRAEGKMPATAKLGNSDNLRTGETVLAIGSPLGDFKNSVTVGVVSATGRVLETNQGYQMEDLIQTDAAINQGNSGGPLVNLAGEVVGINTLVVRGNGYSSAIAEGLGFAIPSSTAAIIAQQIIEQGYFSRPFLGVNSQPINPTIARRYRLPVEWGAYVTTVDPDSPAGKAGIKPGDIIIQIGESVIDKDQSFVNALFEHNPGEQVDIELVRDNQTIQVTAILGEYNR